MPRAHALSLALVISLAASLSACGGAQYARRGDTQLAAGQYDQAIASYERAVRASEGDPAEAARYQALATEARRKAARQQISIGDQAMRARDLSGAGRAFKKARSYAPTDPLVIDRLSLLLKTRVRIEGEMEAAWKELGALRAGDAAPAPPAQAAPQQPAQKPAPAKQPAQPAGTPGNVAPTSKSPEDTAREARLARWDALALRAEGLLEWRRDYPRAQQLWAAVSAPCALEQLAESQRLLGLGDIAEARRRAEKALRLAPGDPKPRALLDTIDRKGSAGTQRAEAQAAMDEGRVEDAIEGYQRALALDPTDDDAAKGLALAQRTYVDARLAEAKAARRKRDRKTELLALRAAWSVNTADPKTKKRLTRAYDKAHKRAIKTFYKAGRRSEKSRLLGAALVSYRIAAALGGGPKDLGQRIERCSRGLMATRRLVLNVKLARLGKGVLKAGADAVLEAARARIAAEKLDQLGVVVAATPKAARKADATLTVEVPAFALPRDSRPKQRKKKFLDRVEFPPNPAYRAAQAKQSAALAELNAATERLRPLQEQVNKLEADLARYDKDLSKLKATIAKEDEAHYQGQPKPCPDGTTNCPQSYAHRRWAKHLAWFQAQIAKTNKAAAAVSTDYQGAQETVARAQEAFDAAEREARETPAKLRKEIWNTHTYNVTAHSVSVTGQAALTLKAGKLTLAEGKANVSEQKIDFSTPGVVIKKQTLEPPRQSSLPTDAALTVDLAARLVDQAGKPVWPRLRAHGERFVLRAAAEKRASRKLDLQVRALSTAEALPADARQKLVKTVLDATGYNWDAMAVDIARIPYK